MIHQTQFQTTRKAGILSPGWASAHSEGSKVHMVDFKQAALLVIDVQAGIDDLFNSPRNNPQAEANIASLIKAWRDRDGAIIHIKHNSTEPNSPLRPESPGNAFKPEGQPHSSEVVFEKSVNSAFIGTGLEKHLHDHAITDLVIVGLTTDHCVSTTTRMAGNLGFNAVLVSDGTATFGRTSPNGESFTADQVHNVNLLSLDGEFCQVLTCAEVLSAVS